MMSHPEGRDAGAYMTCTVFLVAPLLGLLSLIIVERRRRHLTTVSRLVALSLGSWFLCFVAALRPLGDQSAGIAALILLSVAVILCVVALVLAAAGGTSSAQRGFDVIGPNSHTSVSPSESETHGE